MQKVEGSLG